MRNNGHASRLLISGVDAFTLTRTTFFMGLEARGVHSVSAIDTPVVFFIFKRPEKAQQVFEEIKKAKPSRLFIIGDGPRAHFPGEREIVDLGRSIVDQVDWDCEVETDFAQKNLGARRRVASGLDLVFSKVDRAIILEDDCLPDPTFFDFSQELLELYKDVENISLISGNNHLKGNRVTDDSYSFSWQGNTWGWATWARVWHGFGGAEGLKDSWTPAERREILSRIPSWTWRRSFGRMLKNAAHLDAWDIPFAVHCQERGYLSVVPEVNLVTNIGFGVGSTHTKFESLTLESPSRPMAFPLKHPSAIEINHERDKLENRVFLWLRITYPFKHPIEFFMRYIRYFVLLVRSKKAGETGALPKLDASDSR